MSLPIKRPKPDLARFETRLVVVPKDKERLRAHLIPWMTEVVKSTGQPRTIRGLPAAKFLVNMANLDQHDQRDQHRDDAEQELQHRLGDELGGDAAEEAPGRGRDLEQHPQLHVDQLLAGLAGRHRARRRDHRRQADRRGDAEGKSEDEVEEGDEEHAAAEPEQRAQAAGDGAGREDDQRQRCRDCGHPDIQIQFSDFRFDFHLSSHTLGEGVAAPKLFNADLQQTVQIDDDTLRFYVQAASAADPS